MRNRAIYETSDRKVTQEITDTIAAMDAVEKAGTAAAGSLDYSFQTTQGKLHAASRVAQKDLGDILAFPAFVSGETARLLQAAETGKVDAQALLNDALVAAGDDFHEFYYGNLLQYVQDREDRARATISQKDRKMAAQVAEGQACRAHGRCWSSVLS